MDETLRRSDAGRYKIEQLLDLVSVGQIRIPRFQRGLKWTAGDVEKLFDSIYRGFPIGTLLFWRRHAEAARITIGPLTIEAPAVSEALWVVDGQQRITSLAATLLPSPEHAYDPRFELSFDLAQERFVRRTSGEEAEERLPIRDAFNLQRVLSWLRERDLPASYQDRAFRLADRLRNYEIPAYIVSTDDESSLRQIFDRTNTFGKRMTRAEVFHALHSAGVSPEQTDLRTLAEEVGALGFGNLDDNTLLFCVLAQRHPDVLRDFHSEFGQSEDLGDTFAATRTAIQRSIEFLQFEADVPHFSLVPYQHLTVGLVRFFGLHPEPDEVVRVLLRRWFWRAATQGPIARLGTTGTLRTTTQAINGDSAYHSVQSLLQLTGSPARNPQLTTFRWNTADVRIAVAALASLQPRDPATNESISVTNAIESLGRDSLVTFVAPKFSNVAKTAANRVFLSPDSSTRESDVQLAFASADKEVLQSHAISANAAQFLIEGAISEFLNERAQALGEHIANFVSARAEWERPQLPSLRALLAEDADE